MTRKYDTLIHFPGYGRRELRLSGRQRTIVVSKNYRIVEVGEAVYPSSSLSLQGDMGMGEPHSLLAMYVSAEKQTFDHDGHWGRNRKKKKSQHVVIFQTTETI